MTTWTDQNGNVLPTAWDSNTPQALTTQFTPYKNIAATNMQAAIQEEVDDLGAQTGATLIGYTPYSNISSATVQNAINEEIDDLAAQGGAALIGFTPTGNIAATTVQAAIAEEITDLSASTGSSLIGHVASGAGAAAQTIQAKLRTFVNQTDYSTLAQAIAAAQRINLSSGNTSLTTSVAPANNTELIGYKQDFINYNNANASVIYSSALVNVSVVSSSNNIISGVHLKPVTNNVASSVGYQSDGQVFSQLTDLLISNYATATLFTKSQQLQFNRIKVVGCGTGLVFQGTAINYNIDWFNNLITLEDCTLAGATSGANLDFQGQGLMARSCDFSGGGVAAPYGSVRIRAGSWDANFINPYIEALPAGSFGFLCEGGWTKITGGFFQGNAIGSPAGAIVRATGGAIVILDGNASGQSYFINQVQADGAGTKVYIMPGFLSGSSLSCTGAVAVATNGAVIIDLRTYFNSGTFTATLTGCATSPTVTASWQRNGNLVTLAIPNIAATSNTTACTLTGLPAEIQPISTQYLVSNVQDSGSEFLGACSVTGGVVSLSKGAVGTGFSATGVKGWRGTTITYTLY
jgi:hypothetical protein